MRKLILLLLLLSNCLFAQINFEKGYIIDNNNIKKECFIKNEEWKNSPISINYKITENDTEVKTATLSQLKEFSCGDFHKYQKHSVKIDQSSTDGVKFSNQVAPEYLEKEVLLKTIVSGNAVLFEYSETGIKKYFYSINNMPPTDLIYKKYIPSLIDGNENYQTVLENKMFVRQIYKDVNCNQQPIKNFSNLDYNIKELSEAFIAFNSCNATDVEKVTDYRNKNASNKFNIKLKAGLNSIKFSETFNEAYVTEKDFDNKTTYLAGVELEYAFPFNKNKWSVFIEPLYNTAYKGQKIISQTYSSFKNTYPTEVDYSAFFVTIGIRYKMYLSDKISLFLSPSYVLSFPSGKMTTRGGYDLKLDSGKNIGLGIGTEINKKIRVEGRIVNMNYSGDSLFEMQSTNLSLLVSYKIFDNKK